MTVTLFSDNITITTRADRVKAELRDGPEGATRAVGFIRRYEYDRQVELRLEAVVESPDGDAAAVRAGDVLVITPDGEAPVVRTVPELAADIAAAENAIVGRGPPDTSVDLTLRSAGSGERTALSASTDSRGRLFVALDGHIDLRHGGVGTVVLSDGGDQFAVVMATLTADIRIGVPLVRGQATLGSRMRLYVEDEAGQRVRTRLWTGLEVPRDCRQDEWPVIRTVSWCGAVAPVGTGSAVILERVGPTGITELMRTTVPDLRIALHRNQTTAGGVAPANHVLAVRVSSPSGEEYRAQAIADAAGTYSVDFPGVGAFDYRWTASVRDELDHRTTVSAVAALSVVRFDAYRVTIAGVAPEGQPVTATLTSASGLPDRRSVTLAGSDGTWSMKVAPMSPYEYPHLPQRLLPGSAVEIEFVVGDPELYRIPSVTVHVDNAQHTVSGAAPPQATLRVRLGRGPLAPVVLTSADADGDWSVAIPSSVTGDLNEVTVELVDPDGTEYAYEWSAFGMALSLGSPSVSGGGSPGHDVSAALSDAEGRALATGATYVLDNYPSNAWSLLLVDGGGAHVIPEAGDRLTVQMDDEVVSTIIPQISVWILPHEDLVVGNGFPPRVDVGVIIGHEVGSGVGNLDVRSDAEGRVRADFTGEYDILWGDRGEVFFRQDGIAISKRIEAGGLVVTLNEGIIAGAFSPGMPLHGQVTRGGAQLWFGETTSDHYGAFELRTADANGQLLPIQPGDEISVAVHGAPTDSMAMTVPPFTMEVKPELDTVSGTAPQDAYLRIRHVSGFPPQSPVRWSWFGWDEALQPVGSNGEFSVVWPRVVDIGPGDNIVVECVLATGHMLVLTQYQPLMNIPVLGAEVCGYGDVGSRVQVEVTGADGRAAAARAVTGRGGVFRSDLRNVYGMQTPVHTGDAVHSVIGDVSIDQVVPALTAEVDWAAGHIQGTAPPLTAITISDPVTDCLSGSFFAYREQTFLALPMPAYKLRTVSDEAGRFEADIDRFPRTAGEGLAVGFYTSDGNRVYTQVFRPRIEAHVYTDLIEGQVSPFRRFEIVVGDAGGHVKATCEADSDARGRFACRARLGDHAVRLVPSDVVTLTTGGTTVHMKVEHLDFDLDSQGGILGTSEPQREIAIRIGLGASRDGGLFHRFSDGAGRFAFGPDDIPPRAGWRMSDVTQLRLELASGDGHVTVAEWQLRPVASLFVPLCVRRH